MAKREVSKKSVKRESTGKKKEAPARNKGKRGSSRNVREDFRQEEEHPKRSSAPSRDSQERERPTRGRGKSTYGDKPSRESSSRGRSKSEYGDKPYRESSVRGRGKSEYGDKPYRESSSRSRNNADSGDKPYRASSTRGGKSGYGDKPYRSKFSSEKGSYGKASYRRDRDDQGETRDSGESGYRRSSGDRPYVRGKFRKSDSPEYKSKKQDGLVRLNKFLSNAGIASRRDADQLIELGLVRVNGKVVTELGHKVDPRVDIVKYDDKNIKPEKLRYVLLNKPKDFITTMDDPEERKTVMWLVKEACKERVYPVGRLDRQTTGLLLFTNDGELTKKLTHPKHGVQKIYHVETLEKVRGTDLDAIRNGVELEDGFIKADEVSFVNDDPRQVGIRIHSGRNRVVRRIFEKFGYTVKKLDRVMFAGLSKKDLPRGRYRHLSEQEVNFLRMIR